MSAAFKPQGAAASRGWLRRELGATLALSWPLVLANVAVNAMTATDYMMLGWLSPHALAAGALGFNLYMPAFLLGVGVVGALSPIAAAKIGAGETTEGLRQAHPSGLSVRPPRRRRNVDRAVADDTDPHRHGRAAGPRPRRRNLHAADSSGVSRRASCFSPAVRCSPRSSVPVRR